MQTKVEVESFGDDDDDDKIGQKCCYFCKKKKRKQLKKAQGQMSVDFIFSNHFTFQSLVFTFLFLYLYLVRENNKIFKKENEKSEKNNRLIGLF